MKNITICIAILFFCLNSKAQYSTSRKKSPPKYYFYSDWSLGFSLKSSVENIAPNLVFSKSTESDYKPKFSYEAEVFIERKLENNWVMVSGVNYHHLSFEYNYEFPVFFDKSSVPNSDGVIINEYNQVVRNTFQQIDFTARVNYTLYGDEEDYQDGEELVFHIQSVNSIAYLGIPLAIKKEFGRQKLKFTIKAGIEAAYLIQSNIDNQRYHQSGFHIEGQRERFLDKGIRYARLELAEVTINSQVDHLRKTQLNSFFNLGFVHTYKYHTFFLETEWKMGVTPFSIKSNNVAADFLQSYGFKVGFIKRFKENKILNLNKVNRFFRW